MITRTLEDHFAEQTAERQRDPGTKFGVPVAFLLSPPAGVDYAFFTRGMAEIGGTVSQLSGRSINQVVKISYKNRPTELCVHPTAENYLEIYTDFCRTELGVDILGSYRDEHFAVDHSYNRSSVPRGVDAYIRLFLVRAMPNSSWGGYYERQLKNALTQQDRSGLRKETVAIRAKISGIPAPKKGFRKSRNLMNVADVVKQLLDLGMTHPAQYQTDFLSLATFCGMVDGRYAGMTVSIDWNGNLLELAAHEAV